MKQGQLIRTENQQHEFGSATSYQSVWVEKDGKNIPLQFTENEILEAQRRAKKNLDDIPVMEDYKTLIVGVAFVIGVFVGYIFK